jgi:hypothetical protein
MQFFAVKGISQFYYNNFLDNLVIGFIFEKNIQIFCYHEKLRTYFENICGKWPELEPWPELELAGTTVEPEPEPKFEQAGVGTT